MYLLNYAGCSECKTRGSVGERDKSRTEEENGDETITFSRMFFILYIVAESHKAGGALGFPPFIPLT